MIELMLTVSRQIVIPEGEIKETFIRSPGPGGQHVNKTATAVQLRFDVSRADYLSPAVKERLQRLAGNRINAEGVLLIEAKSHRSQERNRQEARQRLVALLRRALVKPGIRHKTQPSAAVVRRRLEEKKRRSALKHQRRRDMYED